MELKVIQQAQGVAVTGPTISSLGLTEIKSVSNADYTILDNDGYSVILATATSANRTITLPSAANNTGRRIVFKRTDNNPTYYVAISGTVDGTTTGNRIYYQNGSAVAISDGSAWYWEQQIIEEGEYTPTFTNVANMASTTGERGNFFRRGLYVVCNVFSTVGCTAAAPTLTQIRVSLPIPVTNFTNDNQVTGGGGVYNTATSMMPVYILANQSNEQLEIRYYADVTATRGVSCTFSYRIN